MCPQLCCPPLNPLPCSFGKQYDKGGAYIRHFLPILKVSLLCVRACSAVGVLLQQAQTCAGGWCWRPRALEACSLLHPRLSLTRHASTAAPHCQDFPAKYIYEPWTAPLAVQQAAGCIIGKDYPQ